MRKLTLTERVFLPSLSFGLIPFLELILFVIVLPSRFATLANLSHLLLRIATFFLFVFLSPSFSLSAVKLDRQTEKCIYERNVQSSKGLRYRGTALITFAAHVSYIYPDGKYDGRYDTPFALVHNVYRCTGRTGCAH